VDADRYPGRVSPRSAETPGSLCTGSPGRRPDLYTHVFPEVQRTAAESMDGVLKDLSQPAKKQRQKRAS
jgi:hypothetical protein